MEALKTILALSPLLSPLRPSQTLKTGFQSLKNTACAFEADVKKAFPRAVIIGEGAPRLATTTLISLPGCHGQAVQIELESQDIFVTTSSACSDNEPETSKVLKAMGIEDNIGRGVVRISLCCGRTKEDYDTIGHGPQEGLLQTFRHIELLMKFAALIILSILLPFHSCSSHKDMGANQLREGHTRLYTFPEKKKEYFQDSLSDDQKEIVFAVLNDFRGEVQAKERALLDPSQDKRYTIKSGGISAYQAYLDLLRENFPGKVAVVNSGSLFGPDKNPEESLFYLNTLDIDVSRPLQDRFFPSLRGRLYSCP